MERETKKVTLPITKTEIEINTYVTGREKRALTNLYLNGDINYDVDSKKVNGLNMEIVDKAQDLAWRTVVVSFNGKKDGEDGFSIVDAILDLRAEDYLFVVDTVNDVTSDKSFEKKKTT
jgi:hypothetical protein